MYDDDDDDDDDDDKCVVSPGPDEEDRGEHRGTGRVRGDQQEDDVGELESIHEAGGAP